MGLKNLLTGILLAGSTFVYGQNNSSQTYEKLSDLYGKKGERISYKEDYFKIPWEQIDSNKITINNLEKLEKTLDKPNISNKEAFADTVFAEAKKLGYKKDKIKNLNAKEAIILAADIVAQRYEYDRNRFARLKEGIISDYTIYLNNDYHFFKKIGICEHYSDSFIGVFDLIKKENKNLENIYATKSYINRLSPAKGFHSWNQLIILTKDSLFFSDIDLVSYDVSLGSFLELSKMFKDKKYDEFPYKTYSFIKTIKENVELE